MNMQGSGAPSHWDRSKSLLFTTLAIWFVFSFVVHWFGEQLNGATGSFPGGYFMAGQGSQIAFVILIFWFVSKQNKLDYKDLMLLMKQEFMTHLMKKKI